MNGTLEQHILTIYNTMDFSALVPHFIAGGGAILLMLTSLFKKNAKSVNEALSLLILLAVFGYSVGAVSADGGGASSTIFGGMIRIDWFSNTMAALYTAGAVLIVLFSSDYLKRRNVKSGEFYSLVLFALTGMLFMTSAADLMIFYLGLETLSISLYSLVAYDTRDKRTTEAGMKYFLMSVFSSAFLLYGIALLFGATGSTSLLAIHTYVTENGFHSFYLLAGMFLMLAGIGFKISLAPFQMWTPDTYQGAPLNVTAFMSTAAKIASLAFLFRLYETLQGTPHYPELIEQILIGFAILTMIAGNMLAFNQKDIKRLLAASSVAHVGYITVALAIHNGAGFSAALFYFFSYLFMNAGLFAVLSAMTGENDADLTVDNLRGLAKRRPGTALVLLFFVFSLAGMPPTIGFLAKFYIFAAAVEAKLYTLAVIGMINSAISAYYYLRILVSIYMKESDDSVPASIQNFRIDWKSSIAIAISLFVVIFAGIYPAGFSVLNGSGHLF